VNRPTFERTVKVVDTRYELDASKITCLEDVKAVLSHMCVVFWDDGSDRYEAVRHLFDDDSSDEDSHK